MIDNPRPQLQVALPDFRNLGVMLRILVIAELAKLGSLAAYSPEGFSVVFEAGAWGFIFEMAVLAVVLALFMLSPWLARLPYTYGAALATGTVAVVAAGVDAAMRELTGAVSLPGTVRAAVLGGFLAAAILAYFNWRQRVLSPALAEARLMALQSRIRPHFLFNCINTALSLLRHNPAQAEAVLLDMSDLFRVLLAEPRALVPLADEIRLARSYIEIEQFRLGDRLRVKWDCERVPPGATVPILLLQPLLENAVRHGVEPTAAGGDIRVRINARDTTLRVEISNTMVDSTAGASPGNGMALANIGERLALHFDAEAHLRTFRKDGRFVVQARLPLVGREMPRGHDRVRPKR